MNILDAAYNLVHDYPGGAHSLGPRMGKSPNTLNHEVGGDGSAKFGLVDAVKATRLSGDFRILHSFAEACDHMCLPLPRITSAATGSVLAALGQSSQRFAALCTEVCQGAADNVISDNELARIEVERAALLSELAQLGQAIRLLNQANKPQGQA
ncbi:MAG: hypothetical protein K2X51_12580 [Burkholderiales bacterium]|nr:hypothetical protein [Burkholderiales bacterium]